MAWKATEATPEELAAELIRNLQREDSARLLIIGTQLPDGYRMRMTMRNPVEVAQILCEHALKTGETDEALQMAAHLIKIGTVAAVTINEEIKKRKAQN